MRVPGARCAWGSPHTAGFSEGTWKSFIKEDELPVCEVREAGSPEE